MFTPLPSSTAGNNTVDIIVIVIHTVRNQKLHRICGITRYERAISFNDVCTTVALLRIAMNDLWQDLLAFCVSMG